MTPSEDLTRQLDAAYAGLRELDDDLAAGRLSRADHAALKQRSERQAAGLLRRLREAERRTNPPGSRGEALSVSPMTWLSGPLGLTLGAVVLLAAGTGLGVVLGRSTTDERPPGLTTGRAVGREGPAPVSPALEALGQEVAADPTPIPKLLVFGHRALDEGQIEAALRAYQRVLAREPKNVEALTHLGLILYQANHVDQALARIDEALRLDPRYVHAYWDRAHILFRGKKDYPAAARALEAFLTLVPESADADRARAMLSEARAAQAGQAPAAARQPGAAR